MKIYRGETMKIKRGLKRMNVRVFLTFIAFMIVIPCDSFAIETEKETLIFVFDCGSPKNKKTKCIMTLFNKLS